MRTIQHIMGIVEGEIEVCITCPPNEYGEYVAWDETHETVGDMHWKRWNGKDGFYHGVLEDLGYAIPRPFREWGIRAALMDFCMGYASGFPVRDIIPFALRSLLPRGVKPAIIEEES